MIEPNQRFGNLTAIAQVKSGSNVYWQYRCDCGKTGVKKPKDLASKTSCGCQNGKPSRGKWLSTQQAADRLGMTIKSVRAKAEECHAVEISKRTWWPEQYVEALAIRRENSRKRCRWCRRYAALSVSEYCSKRCGRLSMAHQNATRVFNCRNCNTRCIATGGRLVFCSSSCAARHCSLNAAATSIRATTRTEWAKLSSSISHLIAWAEVCRAYAAEQPRSEENSCHEALWLKRVHSAMISLRLRNKAPVNVHEQEKRSRIRIDSRAHLQAWEMKASKAAGDTVILQQPESELERWIRKCQNGATAQRKRVTQRSRRQPS